MKIHRLSECLLSLQSIKTYYRPCPIHLMNQHKLTPRFAHLDNQKIYKVFMYIYKKVHYALQVLKQNQGTR